MGRRNGISTCIKGKFGWDFVNSPDRLTKPPYPRRRQVPAKPRWDEALDLVARKFREIKAKNGPDSLAFVSSSKCTNEESYLMQKLARAVIGTKQHGQLFTLTARRLRRKDCFEPWAMAVTPAPSGILRTAGTRAHHWQQYGREPPRCWPLA